METLFERNFMKHVSKRSKMSYIFSKSTILYSFKMNRLHEIRILAIICTYTCQNGILPPWKRHVTVNYFYLFGLT